jgi:hypothetical protein
MNGIPDVLKPLIETHEEDGSPVAVCDPGCRQAYVSGSVWEGYFSGAYLPTMKHCPACGILLGFTDDGRPYRIRHSRVVEALEQAQAERNHLRSEAMRLMNLLIEAQADGNHLRRALEWAAVRDRVGVRTALAATKEAQP